MIRLNSITKVYQIGKRELRVLQDIDLQVNKGEMVAIMGPSGSGKSTLLNLIGLLDRPTSGSYVLDNREVARLSAAEQSKIRGQKVGFIFQSFNLLPYLTAVGNVKLGQKYAGCVDMEAAEAALERVGLADRMHHRPMELSGGEQQRVAIARALAKKPPIILADEPTGNLDSHSSTEIMKILSDLHAEQNVTLIMITHDPSTAEHCQRVLHIQDGLITGEETL